MRVVSAFFTLCGFVALYVVGSNFFAIRPYQDNSAYYTEGMLFALIAIAFFLLSAGLGIWENVNRTEKLIKIIAESRATRTDADSYPQHKVIRELPRRTPQSKVASGSLMRKISQEGRAPTDEV